MTRTDTNGREFADDAQYLIRWPDGGSVVATCECDQEDGDAMLLRGSPQACVAVDSKFFDNSTFERIDPEQP